MDEGLGGTAHRVEGGVFVGAVEVRPAREEVGAGETHVAEACAVRPTAYGAYEWGYASAQHGLLGTLQPLGVGRELLIHIVVAILELDADGGMAVGLVDLGGDLGE